MPKGSSVVKAHKKEVERKKKEYEENKRLSGGSRLYFRLDDGETAVVRFLEDGDELWSSYMHTVPDPDIRFGRKVPCRDQDDEGNRVGTDCPGCESNDPDIAKRALRGAANVVWRNAPVFQRDDSGRVVKEGNKPVVIGHEDQVALWEMSYETLDSLFLKDAKYKGLTSRDFEVTRTGTSFDTKYHVEPFDPDAGRSELSQNDSKLNENKNDLQAFFAVPSYEDWGKRPSFEREKEDFTPNRTSPFNRHRQNA